MLETLIEGGRDDSVVKRTDYSSRDLSSSPSNYMVADNHLYWDLISSCGVSGDSDLALT